MGEEIRRPDGERYDYVSLAVASCDILENVLRHGTQPKLENLVGWEFKGYNSLDLTEILGFRKFKKGFYLDDSSKDISNGINGYNVKVIQNRLGEEWIDVTKKGKPFIHGYYNAYPVKINEIDNKYLNAILLNYNCDKNPPYDPSKFLRDYLVQVYPDNNDLYLGKAYIALGNVIRIFVSFFVLERHNKSCLS